MDDSLLASASPYTGYALRGAIPRQPIGGQAVGFSRCQTTMRYNS
ncbi:MAG TPA: hypothetical protein PLQ56_13805 [Aggregatilineales bacterium]|nr:hypothetical protein [Aggregatilineales bacterium]